MQRFLKGGLAGLADRSHTRRGRERRDPAELECRLWRPPTIQAAMEAATVSTIRSDRRVNNQVRSNNTRVTEATTRSVIPSNCPSAQLLRRCRAIPSPAL